MTATAPFSTRIAASRDEAAAAARALDDGGSFVVYPDGSGEEGWASLVSELLHVHLYLHQADGAYAGRVIGPQTEHAARHETLKGTVFVPHYGQIRIMELVDI